MDNKILSDTYFMRMALKEAQAAYDKNEVPVGAVIVSNDVIIAKAHNLVETLNDVSAHAELLAYTSASNHLGAKFLTQCTMYVTLEPCLMCAGVLFWSRIGKLVYAAPDEKNGFSLIGKKVLHPSTKVINGILADEAAELLKSFFKNKRRLS